MESAVTSHRKLIDIKPAVFDGLSKEAKRQGISLKRLIEQLLEEACPKPKVDASPSVQRIIGSAIPKGRRVEDIPDDRLQYLLSK